MSSRFVLASGSLLLAVGVFLGLRFALDVAGSAHAVAGPSIRRIETPGAGSIADLREPGSPQRAAANPRGKTSPEMKQGTSAEPPSLTTEEEEGHFKWLRETTDEQELRRELAELQDTLLRDSRESVMRRLADGEYEPLERSPDGTGGVVKLDPKRRHLIDLYSFDQQGKAVLVTLPVSEFPDLHKTRREMNWLEDLIAK